MGFLGKTARLLTATSALLFSTAAAPSAPSDTSAAPSAAAQSPQWKVTSFHIALDVQSDGTVHATETISFDFGTAPGHGITDVITRIPGYVGAPVPLVSGVTVTNDDGAAAQVAQDSTLRATTLRIGDPDATVTGVHTYKIAFTVANAVFASSPGMASLLWPAIADWDVPVSDAVVTLTMPGTVQLDECWSGKPTSTSLCHAQDSHGTVATYTQPSLAVGERFTIRAVADAGSVAGLPQGVPIIYPPDANTARSGFRYGTVVLWGLFGLVVVSATAGLIFWLLAGRSGSAASKGRGSGSARRPDVTDVYFDAFHNTGGFSAGDQSDGGGHSGGGSDGGHSGGW